MSSLRDAPAHREEQGRHDKVSPNSIFSFEEAALSDVARTLFSNIRARFNDSKLDLREDTAVWSSRLTVFSFLCDWLESALADGGAEEFAAMASEYLDSELDRVLSSSNRVVDETLFLESKLELVESLMRGVSFYYRRDRFTKAYLGDLAKRYEAMSDRSQLSSLAIIGLGHRNAANLFKMLDRYHLEHVREFSFGTSAKPAKAQEVVSTALSWLPETLEYLSFVDSHWRMRSINTALIEHLPRFTSLQEFASEQWIQSVPVLQQMLDAIPESVTSLTLSLYLDDHMDEVVQIFAEHPIMSRLKRLRIGYLKPEGAARLEALDSFKALELYYFGRSQVDRKRYPVRRPWRDVAEETRQAAVKRAAGEAVALTAEQLAVARLTHDHIDPAEFEAVLFEDVEARSPNVFRVLEHYSGCELAPESLNLLVGYGARSFPLARSVVISLDPERASELADRIPASHPWARLAELHCIFRGAASQRAWGQYLAMMASEHGPSEPMFPAVSTYYMNADADHLRGFIAARAAHFPHVTHLELYHGEEDASMCDAFDLIVEEGLWEHIPKFSFYISDFLASSFQRGKQDALIARWVEHAMSDDVPDYARTRILSALLSKESTKAVLSGLFADLFGVKIPKSARRDVMIDRLLGALPERLRHLS